MNRISKLSFVIIALFSCSIVACKSANTNDSSSNNSSVIEKSIHLVVFDSNGGSPVDSQQIEHGGKVKEPTNPTKEGCEFDKWLYLGKAWSFTNNTITEDITLVASWNYIDYTATFKNDDGTILDVQEKVHYGDQLTYGGETPTKYEDGFLYTFTGWGKELIVTGDMEFIAQYSKEKANYYIEYLDYDGSLLHKITTNHESDAYEYLKNIRNEENMNGCEYEFVEWKEIERNDNHIVYQASGNCKTIGLSIVDGVVEKYNGTSTDVIIPSRWKGKDVTSIGVAAFSDRSSLTSIVIPDSVTSIGKSAFYYCSSLRSITIPNSVTSIGEGAFRLCSSLTSITIPDSVNSIGSGAFANCSSLKYNEYDNAYYLGNNSNPYLVLVEANNTSIASCEIHNNCRIVYPGSFYNCSSLTSIVIPDSVISIGINAFHGCTSLTSITLPFVGGSATENQFLGYIFGASKYSETNDNMPSSLKEVVISDACSSIDNSAFYYCSSLRSITIPDSVTSIGEGAFHGCSKLSSVVIPDSVTSIGNSAFSGCSSLTSIVIPDSVSSIGESAFSGCSKLSSVVIPDSVTSIGNSAFYGCSSLTSIVIPDSVHSIGGRAFRNCSSLKYNEYDNAYYLGNDSNPYLALIETTNRSIVSCEINENCRIILSEAFHGCTSLTSIVIPSSVASIEKNTFYYCPSLTSVTIPNSVTSIGESAFYGCSSLTSMTLPFVGGSGTDNQFLGYIFGVSALNVSETMYYVSSSLKEIIISDACASIGYYAFYGCSSLTSIVIPDSVESIGISAFLGCSSLETIYYHGSSDTFMNGNINSRLPSTATVYFYSEIEPIEEGNYWHYVEGVPTKW